MEKIQKTGMRSRAKVSKAEFIIRWILTHDPIALFEEAARFFADSVRERSGGRMEAQIWTPKEYGDGRRISPEEGISLVRSGDLEMSQTYTAALGKLYEPLWALDLPFLFRDHDHASRVLDGAIGRSLLDGLAPQGLHGLAFTYSGGYRLLSSTGKAIERIEDVAGLRVRTSESPVAQALFEHWGAKTVPAPLHEIPSLTLDGSIDAAESTYPRYWDMGHSRCQPVVNETGHSLFLTSLVVNKKFYQDLPEDLKGVLHTSAMDTARRERAKSVADGEKARAAHKKQGGRVVVPAATELKRFADSTLPVYERFASLFGKDRVEAIRQG